MLAFANIYYCGHLIYRGVFSNISNYGHANLLFYFF